MANYSEIIVWLLRQEDSTLSAKIVDLGDGAGFTRLGLTSRNEANDLPAAFWSPAISAGTAVEMSKPVYKKKFWDPMHGDEITSDECAASAFSFCVNRGETTEIKHIQRALGLNPDGVVGPVTVAALNQPGAGDKVRQEMLAQYNAMYEANPERDEEWINGWRRRALRVYPSLA